MVFYGALKHSLSPHLLYLLCSSTGYEIYILYIYTFVKEIQRRMNLTWQVPNILLHKNESCTWRWKPFTELHLHKEFCQTERQLNSLIFSDQAELNWWKVQLLSHTETMTIILNSWSCSILQWVWVCSGQGLF